MLSKTTHLNPQEDTVVRTRYHWIDKHGEFDASNFQFTIGSVWGAL